MQHILVVEDEEHLAIGIQYNLEAEGYHVTTVGDGPSALEAFEQQDQIDLVVLDLMLPGMSGYAVCEGLRAQGNGVPVLILSARTLAEDRARGFDVGADQYLMKPFDLDELLSRVKNLLARGPRVVAMAEPEETDYRFGRVTVDFNAFQAMVEDETVRLTPLEMKLLRYFIANEGRVVTRDELLEHVWEFGNSPTTRTVDNFVMRLRRYFEEDQTQPRHFLSVRGAGYRFVREPEERAEPEPSDEDPGEADQPED